jgi:UDP:flavonoid glycosyltransferase YjiC (YdhE family)
LICADDIDRKIQDHFRSETLQFASDPPDLGQVSRECDLAILNGTHASTATMLLAGKPVMQIPITGEQFLTAQRTTALGCGPSAPCTDGQAITSRLEWLIGASEPRLATRRIAARYDGFDPADQVRQVASRIGQLVAAAPALK